MPQLITTKNKTMEKDFKKLDNIYMNINSTIDDLLQLQNKLNEEDKIKNALFLQISKLENELSEINILRLNKLK